MKTISANEARTAGMDTTEIAMKIDLLERTPEASRGCWAPEGELERLRATLAERMAIEAKTT